MLLHAAAMAAIFGLWLALCGSLVVAACGALALMGILTLSSNVKYAVLGEPLAFSDFALIASMFRHPRFYFTALSVGQVAALAFAGPALLLVLTRTFVSDPAPHIVGLVLFSLGGGALIWLPGSAWFGLIAQTPTVPDDLTRYGLLATLFIYWKRWRETPDPVPCALDADTDGIPHELIVIVQCESFADPLALGSDAGEALPGLARARAAAWQWGDLEVNSFGAYTMRTEFGVLFGRSEEALGFRRFDPYLTALGEASYALPARLRVAGYHCVFVHPHDMRFYRRDRLMPAIGFEEIVGKEHFAAAPPAGERYVQDRALGAVIGDMIDAAAPGKLIYAVTMENHGPWQGEGPDQLAAYLRHLRNSDAMLTDLMDRMAGARRPAVLVFFGDHRPTIPGVTSPDGARHTPYVILRFAGDGAIETGANSEITITPSELHHAILASLHQHPKVVLPGSLRHGKTA
jgi:hypothetical protein